ncbi:hypothetical protein DFH06DRAFT_1146169 [Mycena polygramma]|nr:hypothetical protein DFH06DRAFT_1146169 [Mycena polygramma]
MSQWQYSTSLNATEKVFAVIGGEKSGVYSATSSSPILPIVIKCTSRAEANAACRLDAEFKRLKCESAENQPEIFAKAIAESHRIAELFAVRGPFYAVYWGRERGIYVGSINDVLDQDHPFASPKFGKFESVKDALISMILRGDSNKMEQLGLDSQKSQFRSALNRAHSQGRDEPKMRRPIFSHIRDLTGIIDTIYGSTTGSPVYSQYNLGKQANKYLHAHGYTDSTIQKIQETWEGSQSSEEFVKLLSPYGMATTEIQWLWEMITHAEHCDL